VSAPGRVVQVSVSRGGVPKRAVARARVTLHGVDGDAHRDREHHGGPDRAVCLYAMEAIRALQVEGHAIEPGALGENLTVEGLPWAAVRPGSRLRVGDQVLLEVTGYTSPCFNIAGLFRDGKFGRVSERANPGWSRVYARVLAPGVIAPSDPVQLIAADDGRATPPGPR
jgi:MOSC domain-containing protein YiiM